MKRPLRIYFIDDEPQILELLQESLDASQYSVTGHFCPQEGLAELKANIKQFDLLVTDHMMPNLLGTKVIEEIKALSPEFPILLATGHMSHELESYLNNFSYRHLSLLAKPYRRQQFIEAVEKLMAFSLTGK